MSELEDAKLCVKGNVHPLFRQYIRLMNERHYVCFRLISYVEAASKGRNTQVITKWVGPHFNYQIKLYLMNVI